MKLPVRVAVNGYGTIGKRIAEAFLNIEGFELAGIVKYTPDYSALVATHKGIPIYAPREKFEEFRRAGVEPAGTPDDLFEASDIIYDASPAGVGIKNKPLYERLKKPAIFQGGEKPGIAEMSYSTLCNYEQAIGKRYLRVVSCNTTGILRVLCSVGIKRVRSVFGVIVRRASDLKEDFKGPVNSIQLDPPTIPSHHSADILSVIGNVVDVKTIGLVVPTTLMHLQVLELEFKNTVGLDEIIDALKFSGRILVVEPNQLSLETTGRLVEFARDAGRRRHDIYENIVFNTMLRVEGVKSFLVQAIHQESIVIPENVDAAYAVLNLDTDPIRVVNKVNSALGVGYLKAILSRAMM